MTEQLSLNFSWGFPGGASGKESACQCRRHKRFCSIPGSGGCPGVGNGDLLQYYCQENSTRQRSLSGYNPRGCKESDTHTYLLLEMLSVYGSYITFL